MSEGTEVKRQAESWETCCDKIVKCQLGPRSLGSYKPVTKSPTWDKNPGVPNKGAVHGGIPLLCL